MPLKRLFTHAHEASGGRFLPGREAIWGLTTAVSLTTPTCHRNPDPVTLTSLTENCPYCGEPIELVVDDGDIDQDYIEDCQVCCQPIEVRVRSGVGGEPVLELLRDSD